MNDVRAGMLVRVSTGGQDEQNQVPDIEGYCSEHNLQLRERYELHDKSAGKGEQVATLERVLADIRRGHIKVLVCWHSDRLDRRGVVETLQFIQAVREAGGRVVSVREGELDENGIHTVVATWVNHEKSVHVVEQTALAHKRIDGNGAFRWKVPFGFDLVGPKYGKKLVPNELGRQYIPVIFARIIDGWSLADVCAWLDSLKLRYRKVRDADGNDTGQVEPAPWWPATVMNLVRNTVYIGHFAADDRTWIHECEPLLVTPDGKPDVATFNRAGEALSDRARKQRGPRGTPEHRAMLRGAIRCPTCDVPMHKNASPNTRTTGGGRSKPYYRCRALGPPGQQRGGCGNNVDMALVDAAVNADMAATWHQPIMRPVLVRGTDHQAELDAIAMELRQLPARNLDRKAEQAERERLWDEEDRVKELPVTEDTWIEVESDEFYDEVYAALPVHERGAWLAANGFTVTACKGTERGSVDVTLRRTMAAVRVGEGQVFRFPVTGGQPHMTIIPPSAQEAAK